jgi:hypothetical protein
MADVPLEQARMAIETAEMLDDERLVKEALLWFVQHDYPGFVLFREHVIEVWTERESVVDLAAARTSPVR